MSKELEKEVIIEISKECNFTEGIIVKLFKRLFVKVYGVAGKNSFNNINKYI